MKVAFDIGGVLGKYPNEFREMARMYDGIGAEIHVITAMSNKETVIELLAKNSFDFIPAVNVHCTSDTELAKPKLLKKLGIDVYFDDSSVCLQWDHETMGKAPLRLLIVPDPYRPKWSDGWKT